MRKSFIDESFISSHTVENIVTKGEITRLQFLQFPVYRRILIPIKQSTFKNISRNCLLHTIFSTLFNQLLLYLLISLFASMFSKSSAADLLYVGKGKLDSKPKEVYSQMFCLHANFHHSFTTRKKNWLKLYWSVHWDFYTNESHF